MCRNNAQKQVDKGDPGMDTPGIPSNKLALVFNMCQGLIFANKIALHYIRTNMKKEDELITYPAVFHLAEEGGYSVEVPDLPGCISEGDTLAEAIDMITDAASGWVLGELEEGKTAPKASTYEEISKNNKGEIVSLIVLDMVAYSKKYGDKKNQLAV